jgi:microsomal epoxide hydrolase
VPSLTGYGFSSGPPLNKDWAVTDTARLMHKLLMSLGFGKTGYAVQGGDVGAGISRVLADQYDECKAIHLNFDAMGKPDDVDDSEVEPMEWEGLARAQEWQKTGVGYALEHGTRPATIGLVLSSSPLALLAWLGEKYREWSDEDPALEEILRAVSLYWLTDSFPRSIYPYRAFAKRITAPEAEKGSRWGQYIKKPYGFSWFPKELIPTPKAWAKAGGNLVWFRRHDKGGHFAALERPEEVATDVEEFLKQVWK